MTRDKAWQGWAVFVTLGGCAVTARGALAMRPSVHHWEVQQQLGKMCEEKGKPENQCGRVTS